MKFKEPIRYFPTFVALTLACVPIAHAEGEVIHFLQTPQDVFAPKGFDDNDNAAVVIQGSIGNFCFHPAPVIAKIERQDIYIDNVINATDGCSDALLYLPYTRVVDLGALAAGHYTVWVSEESGRYERRAILPVAESKPSAYTPDDELYAPVVEVSFHGAKGDGDPTLTISGIFNNTCLRLEAIQVRNSGGNVIEILPEADLEPETDCVAAEIPFEKTIAVQNFPAHGDVLIHVRSMGGRAVNRVVTTLDRVGI